MGARRRRAAGSALLLTAGLALGGATTATAGTPDLGVRAEAPGTFETLTLVTGDHLHVRQLGGGRLATTVRPAPGREHVQFLHRTVGGRTTIVPSDAERLVRTGVLDQRLFDVHGLLEQGFGDAGPLPLIVAYQRGNDPGAGVSVFSGEASTGRVLTSVNAVAVHPGEDSADVVWAELTNDATEPRAFSGGVDRVWLNGRARVLDEESNAQVGAPEVWEAGYTGAGVTVAVLDGGYDPDHPDLVDAVVEAVDFTDPAGTAADGFGHGTHVAATVAGRGAASDGAHRGVAPDADLVVGKVCDDSGYCPEDAIIAGMEWAAAGDAVAVNLSLGIGPTDGTDPMSVAVDTLTEDTGTLFVAAAGNDGWDMTVSSPAAADAALAVGSVTKSDELSDFSSRGPRVGDWAVKPEIAAPGSGIVSARAAGTAMGSLVDEHHTSADGTSMASPHVAGAVALLAEANPEWRAREFRAALMAAAEPLAGVPVSGQGAGRLDVARAMRQSVVAEPSSLSLGNFTWPRDGEEPAAGTVTYRNTGEEDLILDLAVDLVTEDGEAVPADLVELSVSDLLVPAGGAAGATVTVDVAHGTTGYLSGTLRATAEGGVAVSTPVGLHLEPESYDLGVDVLDRDGRSTSRAALLVEDADTGYSYYLEADGNGDYAVRLPGGTYNLLARIGDDTSDEYTYVVERAVQLTSDARVTVDATPAVPIEVRTERPSELRYHDSALLSEDRQSSLGALGFGTKQKYAVPARGSFALNYKPTLVSSSEDEYRYHLATQFVDEIPAEPVLAPRDEELAEVTSRYQAQGVAAAGLRTVVGQLVDDWSLFGFGLPVDVPGSGTDYHSVTDDVEWREYLGFQDDLGENYEETGRVSVYAAGAASIRWNTAPVTILGEGRRTGDDLTFSPRYFVTSDTDQYYGYGSADVFAGELTLSDEQGVLASSDEYGFLRAPVPSEPGMYTLEATATRNVEWSMLGTSARARWTFRSENPGTEGPTGLPLMGVRFTSVATVDDPLGVLPGNGEHAFAVTVEDTAGGIAELAVEYSVDDGETWEPLEVVDGVVSVVHPAEGFVSLRARAADSEGNSVEQAVIRSYQVGPSTR
ncbi:MULTISPECIES: S8 family serine peptidase [Actinoalloteichus]|nr:S8 family serine peptidase [Actinoalloteichus caeruleus]